MGALGRLGDGSGEQRWERCQRDSEPRHVELRLLDDQLALAMERS